MSDWLIVVIHRLSSRVISKIKQKRLAKTVAKTNTCTETVTKFTQIVFTFEVCPYVNNSSSATWACYGGEGGPGRELLMIMLFGCFLWRINSIAIGILDFAK